MNSGIVINKKLDSAIKSKLTDDLGYSQLNVENNKSVIMAQTVAPKKGHQLDDYVGPVDPLTRLRHGQGIYRYPNKFFTFQGNYCQGVKQGRGILKLGDGTVINGMFVNNELTGEAEISYPDGSTYKGSLRNGQKSGFGIFKSKLQQYEGEFLENKRHGSGRYKNSTTTIVGQFQNNKPSGQNIEIRKYNYEYKGSCANGLKSGKGIEISTYVDDNYRYEGQFSHDKFEGKGLYINNSAVGYKYEGEFKKGLPALYPNEFKVLLATTTGIQAQQPNPENFTCITTDQSLGTPIEYELQSENQLYFLIQSCYQGPEQLDPNQPTEEEIDKMIKDWQNENKKNKNPPPMPDFRQPRKIKPTLVLVQQQSERPIQLKLAREANQNYEYLKIDYRQSMKKKRSENEVLKAEAAKKAEEQGNKKGGKGGAKAEIQLKVNAFVNNPVQKQTILRVLNEKGRARVEKIQFPDDFPPGSYQLIFSSPFNLFGLIKQVKKTINIKAKNAGGKKK